MTNDTTTGVYGHPPAELVGLDGETLQLSPLVPGAASIEAAADGSFGRLAILAPPGTVERRFVLAHALRASRPGAALSVMAPKDKGGGRIAAELEAFGCDVAGKGRRHFRIAETARPATLSGVDEAIAAGALRFDETLGLWTQGGVFSSDRIDPGSRLLLDHLPALSGRGADLGCGIGVLGRAVLGNAAVTDLVSIDIDRRAVEAARRNIEDGRAVFRWADVGNPLPGIERLDFAVSNPPFHDGGMEDKALGQVFIRRAAEMLRKGGTAFVVANRHLPYEAAMGAAFARVTVLAETGGYKLFEARK